MVYNEKEIAERLVKCRNEVKMTQEELAGKLNRTRKTLSGWEKGKAIPPLDDMLKMCGVFNCELGYLLGEHDCKTRKVTDIRLATGLSETAINVVLSRIGSSDSLKAKAVITILNALIESLGQTHEMWNLSQSIIAYIMNTHLCDLWRDERNTDSDDPFFPIEDISQHDLSMYKLKRNFDILIEFLLCDPQFKKRAEDIYKKEGFSYHRYLDEQFVLERRIPINISDGSFKTAISQTLALFFDDGYEETPHLQTQIDDCQP